VSNLEEKGKTEHEKEYVIFVNKKELKVAESSLTGREILSRAGYDVNQYDLFLIRGQQSEQIQPDQTVEIKNGLHFNAILKSAPYG
jgi:hypothetical protein